MVDRTIIELDPDGREATRNSSISILVVTGYFVPYATRVTILLDSNTRSTSDNCTFVSYARIRDRIGPSVTNELLQTEWTNTS